jgi:tRNA(Ile2) C34 agmatinyltransferase TiaS
LCKYCNTPRYVREGERGFKCMKCGSYVELSEAKVVKRVQTIRDAIYMVKELKLPEELRGKIPHRGP